MLHLYPSVHCSCTQCCCMQQTVFGAKFIFCALRLTCCFLFWTVIFDFFRMSFQHYIPTFRRKKSMLHMVCSHDTGLWCAERFTVLLGSGSILVRGRRRYQDSLALYQYKLQGGRLEEMQQVDWPCQHEPIDILDVIVEGKELLAVACEHCRDITLMNLETGETHVAYCSEKKPYTICHGEPGKIWVCCRGESSLRELNCSSKAFTETGNNITTTHHYYFMCYLPAPHRALVLSCGQSMEAVSADTGQQLWKLDGEVDGRKSSPWGVTFHAEHQLLLMAIGHNRILVLDPWSGQILQSLLLPDDPRTFTWLGNQLLLLQWNQIAQIQLNAQGMLLFKS